MRTVRLYAAALAVTLAACSQPVSDAQTSIESVEATSSTTTTSSPTATVPPTTEPTQSALGDPLLGATVAADTMLYFNSTEPAWTLKRFQTASLPGNGPHLLVVGDGDPAERTRASITVGPTGILARPADSNSATMGAVIEPVEIAGVAAVGRSSSANGIALTELDWPAPDGYTASMVAVGLDAQEAAALAEHVTFDGTTPGLEPTGGFRVLDPVDETVITTGGLFVNGDVGMQVDCSNDGDVGFTTRLMYARTTPHKIADAVIAQRADPAIGSPQSMLDGAQWLMGAWWCSVWSAPTGTNGGVVPVVPDSEMASFLASLVLTDEATLRQRAPDAEFQLDAIQSDSPPSVSPGAFSSGAADPVALAKFTPDGDRVAAIGFDFATGATPVQLIDATSGALLQAFPGGFGCSGTPTISPDGALIFDGASLRDTRTGRVVTRLDLSEIEGGNSAAFSSDGTLIVVAGGRRGSPRATVYSTSTGDERASLATTDYLLTCPKFLPDGTQIFVPGLMPTARIWDIVNDRVVLEFPVNDGFTSLSPDGKFVAVSDDQHRLVDTASGQIVLELSGIPAAFSPDGTRLATVSRNLGDPCTIWDVTTLRKLSEFPCPTSGRFGADVSFNADGSRIVIARDGIGEVRDTATGELISTLRLDDGQILSAAYSPDGTRIVTANSNGTVRVWPAP